MPKRTDANQAEIVAALRAAGAEVQSLHTVGHGCPDLLVAYEGAWYVAEVKSKKGTLTGSQPEWHERFGKQAPVHVWRTVEQALDDIGADYQLTLL